MKWIKLFENFNTEKRLETCNKLFMKWLMLKFFRNEGLKLEDGEIRKWVIKKRFFDFSNSVMDIAPFKSTTGKTVIMYVPRESFSLIDKKKLSDKLGRFGELKSFRYLGPLFSAAFWPHSKKSQSFIGIHNSFLQKFDTFLEKFNVTIMGIGVAGLQVRKQLSTSELSQLFKECLIDFAGLDDYNNCSVWVY